MADTQAPPAPPQPVYIPVPAPAPAVTAGWATPAGQQPEPKEPKAKRGRGIPAAPAMAAAGNATALSVTSAYAAGGWPAMAAAGGAVGLAAGAAVVQRRRSVKRNADIRKALRQAGSGGGTTAGWSGSGGSSRRGSGSGLNLGSGSGSKDGSRRGGSGLGGSGGGRTSGQRTGSPKGGTSAANRSGGSPKTANAGSAGRLGRALDRMLGGNGKGGADKAARKSASQDAAAAKTVKEARKAAKAAAKQARKDLGLPSRSSRVAAAGRRQATKAWAKSKPHLGKVAHKARGLTADGLRALRSGVWGLLRHRSWAKAKERIGAAWRKHRAERNTPAAPAAPTIASTVRRPVSSTTIPMPGGPGMSGHHFVAPAMEGARAAANYNPRGMMEVGADFAGLKQALELHAEAMRATVENADAKFPLAPQIVEMMRQIHGLQLKAAEMAGELQPAFRKLHQVDIARIEQPRKGREAEAMWDVRSN